MKRVFWLSLGFVMVGLGIIGALLPVMPTTIFLILAVGCFARSSPKLQARLLEHPRYGAALRAWSEERAISLRGKRFAACGIGVGLLVFWIGARPSLLVGLMVSLVMVLSATWIVTRPRPRTERINTRSSQGDGSLRMAACVLSIGGHALALWLVLGHWPQSPQAHASPQVRVQLTFLAPSAPPTPTAATVAPVITPQQQAAKTAVKQGDGETKTPSKPVQKLIFSPGPTGIAANEADQSSPSEAESAPSQSSAPESVSLPPSPNIAGSTDPNWEGDVLTRLEQFKRYPRPAKVRRQEGTVLVRALIDEAGRVVSTEIQTSSGSSLLDREALDTFSRAQPLPAPPKTMTTPVQLDVPIRFFLQ